MSAYEAVRIRLDPTPRQTRLLESHAGGARFAYNLMLAHVQRQISLGEKPDWTLYAMRPLVERVEGRNRPVVAGEQQGGVQQRV